MPHVSGTAKPSSGLLIYDFFIDDDHFFLNMKNISVVIADNNQLIRDSLVPLMNKFKELKVTGINPHCPGNEFFLKKLPHPVVVYFALPDVTVSLRFIEWCTFSFPLSKLIVVTESQDAIALKQYFLSGAHGIISKCCSAAELKKAIEDVHTGYQYIWEKHKDTLLSFLTDDHDNLSVRYSMLSKRERQVTNFIAEGFSSKEIGLQLGISVRTVNSHRYSIFRKMRVSNTASLVNFVCRAGL